MAGPNATGAKTTLIVHEDPAVSAFPQLLICEKGPLTTSDEIFTVPVPGFVKVTSCGALKDPTICGEKTRLAVESDATGPFVPIPLKLVVRLSPFVPFTVRVPDAGNGYVASNTTLILHESPAGIPNPPPKRLRIGQLEFWRNPLVVWMLVT